MVRPETEMRMGGFIPMTHAVTGEGSERNEKTGTRIVANLQTPESRHNRGVNGKVPKTVQTDGTTVMKKMTIGLYVLLILMGVGTGYLLSGRRVGVVGLFGKPTRIETDTTVGISDTATFKDSAEGVIEAGGLDGEGTHKLVREGGPSQTAYLISSVVDLDKYIGKKVKVYGQTVAGDKAAWLMDVGKIELAE